MPSLRLISTHVTETRLDGRMTHAEIPGTEQIIAVTDVSDAATKLQTALTGLVGSGPASTHATAFTARQNATPAAPKHVVPTTGKSGLSATYRP